MLWKTFLLGSRYISRIRFLVIRGTILMIRLYQILVSPLLGSACRFSPSCSQYAVEAINRYGLIKGFRLTTCRLLRCHPWHPGGFDPVP